jgi:hypothetical protein
MKRYIIYAPHKCGSSVLQRITSGATNVNIQPDKDFIIQTDRGEAKLHFSRKLDLNQKFTEEDRFVFIPRNPISICISAYYSFGYTHRKPSRLSDAQFMRWRGKIQKAGLEGYVNNNIKDRCISIQNILGFDCNNKTIIPYELMITNFSDFLKNYLTAIDMSSSYQSAHSKWNSEFDPIVDQSDLIESGEIKTHKRTTDIYEWKKKLNQTKLQNILEEYPVINEDFELLSTYNI